METNKYIKPSIGTFQVPDLMQTILPGGSKVPPEGDAKQNNFMDSDDADAGGDSHDDIDNNWDD